MKAILIFFLTLFSAAAHSQTSDTRASSIADSVMITMGGKHNWEQTRVIKWTFFGRRTLWWDKQTGNVRIEIPAKKLVLLSNLNTHKGQAYRNGIQLTQPDSVSYYMDRAYKIWANDSYWLIMPFKLEDPGVNLKYLGEQKDSLGNECYVLELTFNNVGATPMNKYHVYVDRHKYLVTEFDYYEKLTDSAPAFRDPWLHYQRYGNIMIADDRGEGKITDIEVMVEEPSGLFDKP